jgi:type IV secretion system protein VirD4
VTGKERDWALIGALIVAALCAYAWLVAGLAGLCFRGGWPQLRADELPFALAHWLADPGDPAAGFTRAARAGLPGPAGMYGSLMATSAALACALFALTRGGALWRLGARVLSLRGSGAASESEGARFARAHDLDALIVRAPEQGRVTLGRLGARLLACEPGHSLCVIGPTQSGKTAGLAIPALLEWQGPALVTSVKHDILEHTGRRRAAQGPVWTYDPTAAAGVQSCQWSPLSQCESWRGAQRMAAWLSSAARAAPGGSEEGRFWSELGQKLLAPMLFAAAVSALSMADVMHWLNSGETEEVTALLCESGQGLPQEAWRASIARDERTLSSVYASVEAVLRAYEDPDVLDSALGEGLSGERLLSEPSATAYLCAPVHEQRRLAPLYAALVREVVAAAYDRYARTRRPLQPPLLVLLDEAANIAPVPELGHLASTAAGVGVQIVSVWQDVSQLHESYKAQAATVLNNHRAKLVLPGVADERTLRFVQATLGEARVAQRSRTQGERRASWTESSAYRPLAPASLTRQQRPGEALLIYHHLPPARIRLRPFYADRTLRTMASDGMAPASRRRLPGAPGRLIARAAR